MKCEKHEKNSGIVTSPRTDRLEKKMRNKINKKRTVGFDFENWKYKYNRCLPFP